MASHRVFVCHRNRLLTECLASALLGSGPLDCRVIDAEDPIASLTSLADGALNDLLVLDPTLDGERARLAASQFRAGCPAGRLILMISGAAIGRMMEFAPLQADGWILDDASLSDVRSAIETVLAGTAYCSPRLGTAIITQLGRIGLRGAQGYPDDGAGLTVRELEVLRLIADERLSNKQIARRLHVSLFTVKNHVHHIIEKLGVEDRHEAALLAHRRQLLTGIGVE